jgi:acetyl-CoA acetyltransferase
MRCANLICRTERSTSTVELARSATVGATGARLLVSLLYALRQRGLRRGVAALCLGGGEATAMAIELA